MSQPTSRGTSLSASLKSAPRHQPTLPPSLPQPTHVSIEHLTTSQPADYKPTHHIGTPPTSFQNPWPSSPPAHSLLSVLKARFLNNEERNYVPIPTDTSLLVPVVTPDWGANHPKAWTKLKATWLGHAGFLVEFPSILSGQRGVRVLLDPVFSERMSPVSFLGPKRFTAAPCTLEEIPEVDLVCISHNHYDHLDLATVQFIHRRGKGAVRFLCALGVGRNLIGMGVREDEIVELDWWDSVEARVVQGGILVGMLKLVCTPCQHSSGRGIGDQRGTLWCSWVIEDEPLPQSLRAKIIAEAHPSYGEQQFEEALAERPTVKKLFFGGDTAYRSVPQGTKHEDLAQLPVCPAFADVGKLYGPFDLSLLPIGCYSPRAWMSPVHCAPEDSVCIHKDIRSKKSIGMHYGTIRGGISQYYEEVTEPPRKWREACEEAGLKWQDDIGTCKIGETVLM